MLPIWWLPRQNRRTICLPAGLSEGAYQELTCLLVEPVSPCSPKMGCEDQWGKTEKGETGKRGMHTERAFSSSLETLCCPLVCVKVHPSSGVV